MVSFNLPTVLAAFFCVTVSAFPTASTADVQIHFQPGAKPAVTFPFNKIVAFGDDFTDDGSGSYAHGITGNPKTGAGSHMWGYNTFTDGYVSVTYLAQQLRIPIAYNYAWGSSGGANTIGSICDNSVIPKSRYTAHAKYKGQLVPSALDQVQNYTSTGQFTDDIANTLHFFWTGNNDVIGSLAWGGRFTICITDLLCIPSQTKFITKLTNCFETGLRNLISAGAQHILVPNVYPRQAAPWTTMWITQTLGLIGNFGSVIDQVNQQLQATVDKLNAQHGTNIMYYDVNTFLENGLNNPSMVGGAGYGDTCVDSCSIANPTGISNWNLYWNHTVVHHKPDLFFWMTEVVPSTTVLNYVAHDMTRFLSDQYSNTTSSQSS